jgi:hypothetical protein
MYCAGGFAAMQLEPLGFVSATQRDRLINCNHAVVPLGRKVARAFSQAKPLLPIEHLAEKLIEFPLAIKPRLGHAIEIGEYLGAWNVRSWDAEAATTAVHDRKTDFDFLNTQSSSISSAQVRL